MTFFVVYSGNIVSRRQEVILSWVWRLMPGIPALGRWRQKGCNEFKISLDYTVRISQNNFHVLLSELKQESCLEILERQEVM